MAKGKRENIGTVSIGTMQEEDLIPAFIHELRRQTPTRREHLKRIHEIETAMESDKYFAQENENVVYDLESLYDALNEYAPAYFYFGSHPGDGADFGFWLEEYFETEFDGLRVSDLSEIPSDYHGEEALPGYAGPHSPHGIPPARYRAEVCRRYERGEAGLVRLGATRKGLKPSPRPCPQRQGRMEAPTSPGNGGYRLD